VVNRNGVAACTRYKASGMPQRFGIVYLAVFTLYFEIDPARERIATDRFRRQ
jgi:hypothetical protein